MRITFPNLDSIISEVPNFLGFVPTESLVLVATHTEKGTTSSRIPVVAARADLPQPERHRELADYVAAVCGANTADMGIAVLISDTPMHEHHALVTELATTFTRHNLGLHAVWTTLRPGETWCSYHDDEGHGIIHDTSASPVAAAAAVAGFSRYTNRAEMEATLAPVPDPQRADWAQRLAQHPHTDTSARLRDAAAPVFTALQQLRAGQPLDTDQAVAALAAINNDMRVRDLMFTIEEPAALQLWTILVRHAPEDDVPNPAMLLAVAEHLHGNEPIATVALQRALTADPDHRHAQLLRQVFKLPPETLHDALDDLTEHLTRQLD